MAFVITKDHIADAERGDYSREGRRFDAMPLHGMERLLGLDPTLPDRDDKGKPLPWVKFKLFDDDGELHYEGEMHDDEECINQQAALRFGESDTGCTHIKVWRESPRIPGGARFGSWVVEIG